MTDVNPSDQIKAHWRQIDGVKTRLDNLPPEAKTLVQALYRDAKETISLKVESKRRWFIARGILCLAEHFGNELEPWHFTCVGFLTGDYKTPVTKQFAKLDLLGSDNFYRLCTDVMVGDLYPIFTETGVYWQRS